MIFLSLNLTIPVLPLAVALISATAIFFASCFLTYSTIKYQERLIDSSPDCSFWSKSLLTGVNLSLIQNDDSDKKPKI